MAVGQDLLVYACICGYTSPDKKTFNLHLINGGKKDGKGIHKSKGRVNPSTGEIVMPPFNERSLEQKQASIYALKKKDGDGVGNAARQTEFVQYATQIKFVPRVLVCTLTPTMLAGWAADRELWGWPETMPFEDVINHWCIHFHRDRGVELTSYVVKDPQTQEAVKAQNLATQAEEISTEPPEKEEDK